MEMIDKMEDVCLVKIGRSDHKFECLGRKCVHEL